MTTDEELVAKIDVSRDTGTPPVKGGAQRGLIVAAREFSHAAPYRTDARIWYAEGMKRWHPLIPMYESTERWNYTQYPGGHQRQIMVSWGLRPEDNRPYEYCFIRVMMHGGPASTYFEFYTRVNTDGTMVYRTESRGALLPPFAEFVRLLGVDPCLFDSKKARREEAFNPAITGLSRGMASTERPFQPRQAALLARYLVKHKGGKMLRD